MKATMKFSAVTACASVMFGVVGCGKSSSREETARNLVKNVECDLLTYYMKHGKFPESLDVLTEANTEDS